MQNLSHKNEFDLHENSPVEETQSHLNGPSQTHSTQRTGDPVEILVY